MKTPPQFSTYTMMNALIIPALRPWNSKELHLPDPEEGAIPWILLAACCAIGAAGSKPPSRGLDRVHSVALFVTLIVRVSFTCYNSNTQHNITRFITSTRLFGVCIHSTTSKIQLSTLLYIISSSNWLMIFLPPIYKYRFGSSLNDPYQFNVSKTTAPHPILLRGDECVEEK